jgi:hypothetical protein
VYKSTKGQEVLRKEWEDVRSELKLKSEAIAAQLKSAKLDTYAQETKRIEQKLTLFL